MAERTGDPDTDKLAIVVEGAAESHHGILPQQLLGAAGAQWIVQDELQEVQAVEIHLDTQPERLDRLDLAVDDFVEAGCVGPELLITESVVPEHLPSLAF